MIFTGSTLVNNGIGRDQDAGAFVGDYTDNAINFNTTPPAGTITAISKH